MPSVEYSTCDLMDLLEWKVGLEDLSRNIPMMGVDLECIDDDKTCVEVFPNRPDMLSVEGFARSIRGFLGFESGLPKYTISNSDISVLVDKSVLEVRPCVAAACVEDIKLDENTLISVMDMQEKLHLTHGRNRSKVAIGVHDLDKIKPPITYKAVSSDAISFIPLDTEEQMDLGEILRRHPKGMEYAHLLEGAGLFPVFTDSTGDVLSFPPIINSELTKLTPNSRNLFIELTGTSQNAVDKALYILCSSLSDRGGSLKSITVSSR
jgi:phenylalanyl-tRNA synthetase beta chain